MAGGPVSTACPPPATVVHHRKVHMGDWSLFIDPENDESLCAPHHDTVVQREEARGYTIGRDDLSTISAE